MSGSLIMFLMKQTLPMDILRSIMQLYAILAYKAAGQYVFESPCGHLLRRESGDCEHPIYDKIIARSSRYNLTRGLVEIFDDDIEFLYQVCEVDCEKCDRWWVSAYDDESDLMWKFACFCGTIAHEFPCPTCSAKFIECVIPDCNQMFSLESGHILCREHRQCKKCDQPLDYLSERSCSYKCCFDRIRSRCSTCDKDWIT